MQAPIDPKDRRKPKHAFVLGWPLGSVGGVNEVVRNLMDQCSRRGLFSPLLLEVISKGSGEVSHCDLPTLRVPLKAPWAKRTPLKALFSFLICAPVMLWRLRSLCRKQEIEILNPHFVSLDFAYFILLKKLKLFRGSVLFSFHGSDIRSMLQSSGLEHYLNRWLLRGADFLVPCSEGLADEVRSLVPECHNRIKPVQNGIDVDRFLDLAGDFELSETYGRRKNILTIGAFEYKKGHDVLLRALAILKQSHPDVCLTIVGQTGPNLDATRKLVEELKLNEDVLLLENQPRGAIVSLLQQADLFALSSRWEKGICGEGFAMALLEAGAAQKPVVSTLSCGVSELVVDGHSGWLIPPEDPRALASALAQALNDRQEGTRRAANLHETVRTRFTWSAAYRAYADLSLQYQGIRGARS